jgi:multidrug resistance protein, MATE family
MQRLIERRPTNSLGRAARRWWLRPCGGREVLGLAYPLVLSSLSWTVLTFVDRMYLYHWSQEALAASFPAALLWWALICCPLGICQYVGTFVSQYFGNDQPRRIGPVVWQGAWIGLLASPLAMLPILFADRIFAWAGHAPQVRADEVTYFWIVGLSTPAMLVSNALSCFYSGRGKTQIVMVIDVGTVVVNIVLDYLWIFGHAGFPAAGIAGAAWATTVAIFARLAVYLVLLSRTESRREFASLAWRFDWSLCRRLLEFGGPAGLQMVLEVAGFTVFVFLVGSLGVEELAATNLAFNVSSLAFMPVFGVATAASILVGQQLGRDAPHLAERGTWTCLGISLLYMTAVSTLYVTVPDLFLLGFIPGKNSASNQEVHALAVVLLRYVAAYNLFDALNMVFVSAIKGAGDTRFVFVISLIMAILLAVGTWVAMVYLGAGLHGCWMLVTAWICALGVVYGLRFRQGVWRGMRVIDPV